MATTILLVRHAAHPLLGKVLCGRMPNVELDEVGRSQAVRLAAKLAKVRADALLSSPLSRALDTAAAIGGATGLTARPCEALNEIDFGSWTGAGFSELADDLAWSRWNEERSEACPPSGEPMCRAQARAVAHIQHMQVAHPQGTVIAVSHADIIKSVLLWCLGLTLDAHARFDIEPASTSAIVLWENGGKVLWMNQGVTA